MNILEDALKSSVVWPENKVVFETTTGSESDKPEDFPATPDTPTGKSPAASPQAPVKKAPLSQPLRRSPVSVY